MSLIAKVCGITCAEDAAMALAAGADLLGFVRHPASPRHCTDLAAAMHGVGTHDFGNRAVLVIVGDDLTAMVSEAQAHGMKWLQPYVPDHLRATVLHSAHAAGLRVLMPWPDQPQRAVPADLYVWETAPTQTGVHGGSGQTHAATSPPPGRFLLAGGMDAGTASARLANLHSTVRQQCAGIDAASRLESAPGRKAITKTQDYIRAVHSIQI